jgi:hypothetical protein
MKTTMLVFATALCCCAQQSTTDPIPIKFFSGDGGSGGNFAKIPLLASTALLVPSSIFTPAVVRSESIYLAQPDANTDKFRLSRRQAFRSGSGRYHLKGRLL